MKKIIIVILITIFLVPINIYAMPLCTSKIFSELKNKAYKVTFEKEFKKDENGDAYFEITATNLPEELEIYYAGTTYKKNTDNEVITINHHFNPGETYTFEINVSYGYTCVGETAYKRKVTLPKYNIYSENSACIEYEEFELCNKWYKGDIPDINYFVNKLEEYKKSLNPEEEIKEEKKIFEKIIDFYIDNMIYTIPITIVVVGGITYFVVTSISKKKKRAKIDIDFDE